MDRKVISKICIKLMSESASSYAKVYRIARSTMYFSILTIPWSLIGIFCFLSVEISLEF